ncbi:hypothetical protein [Cellvibrio sp.]
MEYFPVKFKLGYKYQYLIWCSGQLDQLFVLAGIAPAFKNTVQLNSFAKSRQLELSPDNSTYNLDQIKMWCKNPTSQIEPNIFLNVWNIFGDLAAAFPSEHKEFERLTQNYLSQYNKLFYGCNLLSRKAGVKPYAPVWSAQDLQNMRIVFMYGLTLVRRKVRLQNV